MSVVAFEDALNHNTKLIRKALGGSVFAKRWVEGDAEITQIYKTSTGLIIPPGYTDVGVMTKDQAVEWERETDAADVESWGYGEPTRRDIVKDVTTMKWTMQESKRQVFELYNGVNLSAVAPDADGNVVMDKPRLPQAIRYRFFQLAKDGDGADAIYFMRALPNAQITEVGGQKWGENDEIVYPVTATGFFDEDWGTSAREIWGGPGLDAAAMGFTA